MDDTNNPNQHNEAEYQRTDVERNNSLKFDNDIDLDREKTRDQLGFQDTNNPSHAQLQERASMKDRFATAQAEAKQRNGSRVADQTQPDTKKKEK